VLRNAQWPPATVQERVAEVSRSPSRESAHTLLLCERVEGIEALKPVNSGVSEDERPPRLRDVAHTRFLLAARAHLDAPYHQPVVGDGSDLCTHEGWQHLRGRPLEQTGHQDHLVTERLAAQKQVALHRLRWAWKWSAAGAETVNGGLHILYKDTATGPPGLRAQTRLSGEKGHAGKPQGDTRRSDAAP
jgi:hypothetical protein